MTYLRTFAFAFLVASLLSILPWTAQTRVAQAQSASCVVGMSMDMPPGYAVANDGPSAAASGYPIIVFGPTTFDRCGAWMALAGIPGWAAYASINLGPSVVPPAPESRCTFGQNCCYVGATWDEPPRYAIGYDGMLSTGSQSLSDHGYHSIVVGPVSVAACHAWWNDNIAAAGLGSAFPSPQGVVPFPSGAFGAAAASRAPPPNGPSGPQGPRSTARGISIALNPSAWIRQNQYIGAVSANAQGLIIGGGPWTNGRLQNGAFDGNYLLSQETFDLGGGGDIYVALAIEAGGQYLGFVPRLMAGVSANALTTHNAWANSTVVPERTWIFLHLQVRPDTTFDLSVALGGYDDAGGEVIYGSSGTLARTSGPVELRFVDNYAGEAASVLIGEAWVYPGTGQQAGAGGSCSTDADCPNSVCLLGMCAPPVR